MILMTSSEEFHCNVFYGMHVCYCPRNSKVYRKKMKSGDYFSKNKSIKGQVDILSMQVLPRTCQPCRGLMSVVMRFLCVLSDNAEDIMVSGFVSEQLTSSMTAVNTQPPGRVRHRCEKDIKHGECSQSDAEANLSVSG